MENAIAAIVLALGFELGRVSARTESLREHLSREDVMLASVGGLAGFLLVYKFGRDVLGSEAAGVAMGVAALETAALLLTRHDAPKAISAPTPNVTTPPPQTAVVAIARSGRSTAEG